LLQFDNGATASLVYGGYGFFDSDEFHFWVGERGTPKSPAHGAARRALAGAGPDEAQLRTERFAYGADNSSLPPHQPHFGVIIVTCARGEMRASADGLLIYDQDGLREIKLPASAGMPGRAEVLDDMIAAIRAGRVPVQDGRWGKATLEVALAMLQSSREQREITLLHQVKVPDGM
jgi:phthalate 4,5-cis-dihydrodiol dehydrogenase